MKLIFLLLALLFAVASSEDESSGFIIGGADATIEEFPYMAGVFNLGVASCGGTIINYRSVLTAAHCIQFNSAPTISVSVGSSRRRGQGGTTYRALRLSIHPEYFHSPEPFRLANDVAVVKTINHIVFGATVQTIPLGREFVPAAAQVVLTGWGMLGNSGIPDLADQLQKLEMVVIPNLRCSLLHVGTEGEGAVTDEKICTTAEGQRGVCGGDSGGPITWQGTVVGITSWSNLPCGSAPSVFIRVAHHVQWIEQQL